MRWIFEASRIEHQNFIMFLAQSADRTEMAVTGLAELFPRKIANQK